MKLQPVTSAPSRNNSSFSDSSCPPVPPRAQRILVVADDKGVLRVFSTLLARNGFDVTSVFNGEQAWEVLHHENFDLLITDRDMPGLTGIHLIERMRKTGMGLPAILVSGSLDRETNQNYRHLQIAALVAKPFDTWDFLNTISKALREPDVIAPFAQNKLSGAPASTRQPKIKSSRHKLVLIADDDSQVRGSLVAVLESEGYLVDEASDGNEAVARALKQKPDLVLLDLNMPHADGWTAFNQLDRVTPLLPVIVITARPNQYQEAVRVGVDAFMEKPLNIPILVSAVKRLTDEDEGRHLSRITKRTFVTKLLGNANP